MIFTDKSIADQDWTFKIISKCESRRLLEYR